MTKLKSCIIFLITNYIPHFHRAVTTHLGNHLGTFKGLEIVLLELCTDTNTKILTASLNLLTQMYYLPYDLFTKAQQVCVCVSMCVCVCVCVCEYISHSVIGRTPQSGYKTDNH